MQRDTILPRITHLASRSSGTFLLSSVITQSPVFLFRQVSQARRVEQSPIPSSSDCTDGYNAPKQDHCDGKDGAQDLEEQTGKNTAKLHGAQGHDSEWESEAPPAHIERERTRLVDRGQSEAKPSQAKCPHDESNKCSNYKEDVACHRHVGEELGLPEDTTRDATEVGNGITSHSQRSKW